MYHKNCGFLESKKYFMRYCSPDIEGKEGGNVHVTDSMGRSIDRYVQLTSVVSAFVLNDIAACLHKVLIYISRFHLEVIDPEMNLN